MDHKPNGPTNEGAPLWLLITLLLFALSLMALGVLGLLIALL